MTAMDLLAALDLPDESRVDQRVPKKLLVEHGAPTAADKRQINEAIEELQWLAALKPTNIGVPAYRDETREILEIAVLSLAMRPPAKPSRLTELVHRSIPYPVVLLAEFEGEAGLSLGAKRNSQGEAGRVVLESGLVVCRLDDHPTRADFLQSLPVTVQPRSNLWELYRGWIACAEAFLAARLTGRFDLSYNAESAALRRTALAECDRIDREVATLRAQASRETQVNRRVELNLAVQRLEASRAEAAKQL
jgi:hypothetical protein